MNDILARRARRATMGIALSVALAAGIAPVTAIAAEISSPTDAVALQTAAANSSETAATEKDKAYAAMQEALKNLEAAKRREPLPAMQANVDAAQAKYDEAHNRVSELQAELKKAYDNGDYAAAQQLRSEIMMADSRERSCEYELAHYRSRLESQKGHVQYFESAAEEAKASVDENIAKRNALTDDLEKAQAAYDDACKAYEEAKAAADKAASPEITQPTETTPPSSSAQPAETTQPAGSSATGKGAPSSSTKQANTSSGKQATTTADKLVNTGDTAPSAIALAGIAATGLGITATATRRLKNSK